MSTTIMQRVQALVAKATPDEPMAQAAASIARKLTTADNEAAKVFAIAGHLRKFTDEAQAKVLAAVESLIVGAPADCTQKGGPES